MTPLPFSWPYWPVFWVVVIWAFGPEFRIVRAAQKPAARPDSLDAGSCRVITRGGGIASLVAFAIAWAPFGRVSTDLRTVVFGVGILLIILGSLLRRHCWRMLGSSFTGDVRAEPNQKIVTTGAYRLLRHPSYSAGILMNCGVGLALGSWASAVLLTLAAFVVYGVRIRVEEAALVRVLGEPYREFMGTRRRIIPFIY